MKTVRICVVVVLLSVLADNVLGDIPGWQNQDIGTTGGSATQQNDTIIVTGDGPDWSILATSILLRRCLERSLRTSPSPPR